MAKPRIFISSTFYDLRQIRADIEFAIKDLGYETILNEKGDIPYGNQEALQNYCYKEINQVDMLIGIIGGRFGSEGQNEYSVTQSEIKAAQAENKQVYIFVEKSVLGEYGTFIVNKDTANMKFRHADDIRVYQFIDEVYSLKKNNIVHAFENSGDIIRFLKAQWAGLFTMFIRQQSINSQNDIISLKVEELSQVTDTLKTYMEQIITKLSPDEGDAPSIIVTENRKLDERRVKILRNLPYIKHLINDHSFEFDLILEDIRNAKTLSDLRELFKKNQNNRTDSRFNCVFATQSINNINKVRTSLELEPFEDDDFEFEEI